MIGAVMIVGPERGTIDRCLSSLAGFVDPHASTVLHVAGDDGTAERCREWGAHVSRSCSWTDDPDGDVRFDDTLNELFRLAHGRADYFLHVGPTDTVTHDGVRDPLAGSSYFIRQTKEGSNPFLMPALTRGSDSWRWRGVVHSYLTPLQERRPVLPGVTVTLHDDDGRRDEKLRRYARMMLAAYDDPESDERDRTRYAFYIAQSYRDLGDLEQAAFWYLRRAGMGGFEEERWLAEYEAACLIAVTVNFAAAVSMLLSCWHNRPYRAEPLRALARFATMRADAMEKPVGELLSVMEEAYVA